MTEGVGALGFLASCPRGIEGLLADELRTLGCRQVRPLASGVAFTGPLPDAYRVCLWSRLASRVLLPLGRVSAQDAEALYQAVAALLWEDHIASDGTLAVDARGTNDALRNTQFTAVKVKDAIVDRIRERSGERPSVDTDAPDVRVNVAVRGATARIAIDLSGDSLHRRGYREAGVGVAAPLKEPVAAAVLIIAGWPGIAERGGALVDPLCGSGTIPIEAALMAGDIAPGILRDRWGFSRWLGHDSEAWDRLIAEADDRAEAGRSSIPPIIGSDEDARAIGLARANAARAGLSSAVTFSLSDALAIHAPEGVTEGLVAMNPPYGERLALDASAATFAASFGRILRERFAGWTLATIAPDDTLASRSGWPILTRHELFNGPLEVVATVARASSSGVEPDGPSEVRPFLDPGAEGFENRLAKRYRELSRWARRAGVGSFRVYDADLPDFNVAVDLFVGAGKSVGERWAVVSEYAPPRSIDAQKADARLTDVLSIVPDVLDVAPDRTFLKVRRRAKGGSQYAGADDAVATSGSTGWIEESGLLFAVDFSDRLDPGIFLDHRLVRESIRTEARGKRFLNLFAYTGTASVYAAAGGAASTTTVDLSQRYLDVAMKNMTENGLGRGEHTFVREDVLWWIAEKRRTSERWDLILADVPTFSNSAKMRSDFDVQRDHGELLIAISRLLAPGGVAVFSNNRRGFTLDEALLDKAKVDAVEITQATRSEDFKRGGGHRAWRITRRAGGAGERS